MALLLRLNKAAPLTAQETDDNFLYLETRITSMNNLKLNTSDLLVMLKLVDGINSGLDADAIHGMKPYTVNTPSSLVQRDASGNFAAGTITASLTGTASHALQADTLTSNLIIAKGGTGSSSINSGIVLSNGTYLYSVVNLPGSNVSGNIPGNSLNVTGVVAIENGGTGTTTAVGARQSLGLIIGGTVQAYSSLLTNFSNIAGQGIIYKTAAGAFGVKEFGSGDGISIFNGAATEDGNVVISISNVPISKGGTSATTSVQALANLGGAPAYSPSLSGIPTTPTAAIGTETNQIASTEFVIQNGVPVGTVIMYAGLAIPFGYLHANGAAVSRITYSELFTKISIAFGAGDNVNTFNLPNCIAPGGPSGVLYCIKV